MLEKTLESPLDCKKIQPVHPKGDHWVFTGRTKCWSWNSNTLATWWEELTHWKRSWFWERLRAGGEGDDRGWDVWMALQIQWTWVWVNSGSWWWTVRPSVLRFLGSQRVGQDWATELDWTNGQTILHSEGDTQIGSQSYMVSSTSVQKLSCGSCSAFKWSFDEFEGEEVVSHLIPPPSWDRLYVVVLLIFLADFSGYDFCAMLSRNHESRTLFLAF